MQYAMYSKLDIHLTYMQLHLSTTYEILGLCRECAKKQSAQLGV